MGNYRFKFSDMIPNAWFYKLRDNMNKGRKQTQTQSRKKKQSSTLGSSSASTTKTEQSSSKPKQPHQFIPRKSYHFTRELNTSKRIYNTSSEKNHNFISDTNFPTQQQQRKSSSKQRPKRRTPRTATTLSSPKLFTTYCSCHNHNSNNNKNPTFESMSTKSTSQPEHSSSSSLDSSAESEFPEPEFRTDRVLTTESFEETVPWPNKNSNNCCCGCRVHSNTNDIIIDVDSNSIARTGNTKLDGYDYDDDDESFSDLVLPPIVTKPAKFNDLLSDAKRKESKPRNRVMASNEELNMKGSLKVKIVKEEDTPSVKEQRNITTRRFSVSSPGVRLRNNSPKIGSRKVMAAHGRRSVSSSVSRRSLSDSFAVVKSSLNPQRDFRESMVEMIVQNNIRTSKDLEDLLACYLSLNSDEYHELIINVFKQIWLDLTDITCRKNNLS